MTITITDAQANEALDLAGILADIHAKDYCEEIEQDLIDVVLTHEKEMRGEG